MRRLVAARGDVVHVDVERPRRRRVQLEPVDAAFLESFAQRDLLAGGLARVAVAPGLDPQAELAVVEQQHARSVGRDRDRAAGQVALRNRAIERPLVALDERDDAVAVGGLLGVRGREPSQRA